MDPLFLAMSKFRKRQFEECIAICEKLLAKNQFDQAPWLLKMRAMLEVVYIDEVETEPEGIADALMDDNVTARTARPGTSLKKPGTSSQGGPSPGVRPTTQSGRPVTGFARPGTQSGRPGTMEQALRAPRTARTGRPVTSNTGRFVRLGTASMVSHGDGPFVNFARLNIPKYALRGELARVLFDFAFHHESDTRSALQIASTVCEAGQADWWWRLQMAKCHFRLGLFREAEQQLRAALETGQPMVELYQHLARVYARLDQPLQAVQCLERGLDQFPADTSLLTGVARIHDGLNDANKSVECYSRVLRSDPMSVEAIASVGTFYFYTDRPEIALKFYRRLLHMGIQNSELLTNLALCCFYAQQYDMCLSNFERALRFANDETVPDIWYNVGVVSLAIGDTSLAYQCFRLALSANNDHAESYTNLGVIEWRRGHAQVARAFFQAAQQLAPAMWEPHYNAAVLADQAGDVQTSYNAVKMSLSAFPDHTDSKQLLGKLAKLLEQM